MTINQTLSFFSCIVLLFLFACKDENKQNVMISTKEAIDTFVTEKEIAMYNENYLLKISKFIAKEPTWEIKLTKNNKLVFAKELDKGTFKLDNLQEIEYESVRSNSLYFHAKSINPDSNLHFSIFYQTPKVRQIQYVNKLE